MKKEEFRAPTYKPVDPGCVCVQMHSCVPQAAEVIVWNNSLLFEDFWKLTGRCYVLTYFIPSLQPGLL